MGTWRGFYGFATDRRRWWSCLATNCFMMKGQEWPVVTSLMRSHDSRSPLPSLPLLSSPLLSTLLATSWSLGLRSGLSLNKNWSVSCRFVRWSIHVEYTLTTVVVTDSLLFSLQYIFPDAYEEATPPGTGVKFSDTKYPHSHTAVSLRYTHICCTTCVCSLIVLCFCLSMYIPLVCVYAHSGSLFPCGS